jgi:hypothetical protein
MDIRLRPIFALIPLTTFMTASTGEAQGCFVSPDKSQTISVSMTSGVTAEVFVSYYKGIEGEDNSSTCYANTTVRLSSFPSSRLATRPDEIAAAIRELADEWSAAECEVFVTYENDTGDDLEDHEQCVKGTFKYDKGDYWSSSPETNCWEAA